MYLFPEERPRNTIYTSLKFHCLIGRWMTVTGRSDTPDTGYPAHKTGRIQVWIFGNQKPAEYSGCSPKLFTNLGPEGVSGQKYKYYLLKDGNRAGIYMDQKIVSAFARKTNQSEPKGYREDQQQQIIDVPTTPTHVHWEEEIDKTIRMADLLTMDAAPLLPGRRSPTKVTSSSTTPRQNQTTFAKVPSGRCSPSKVSRVSPSSPSKGKGEPCPHSAFADQLGSSSVETEVQEEVQALKLFVVRFSGGADFYDNWDDAFKAFLDLMNMNLRPVMRTTADPKLAQNFANLV
ncbi:hypothetical protein K435DRAFT_802336 [Dendrothele bispora CBS 962.96]|uniref:Uncharacterized protein n=1 Tax=Dendrothele bispora (strain CBS 962.96) TaxID=1314807 RepID=A0A4V4HE87_DENBC|nr:hypothetical protein K435DRAFT_802336 [Dendrothele bispora CBS 962.96]